MLHTLFAPLSMPKQSYGKTIPRKAHNKILSEQSAAPSPAPSSDPSPAPSSDPSPAPRPDPSPAPSFENKTMDFTIYNDALYSSLYPDLRLLGNELRQLHWEDHGKGEGRIASYQAYFDLIGHDIYYFFDHQAYRESYEDLKQVYNPKEREAILLHYVKNGLVEGREGIFSEKKLVPDVLYWEKRDKTGAYAIKTEEEGTESTAQSSTESMHLGKNRSTRPPVKESYENGSKRALDLSDDENEREVESGEGMQPGEIGLTKDESELSLGDSSDDVFVSNMVNLITEETEDPHESPEGLPLTESDSDASQDGLR